MNHTPSRVSVIIPVYNRRPFLAEAVGSLVATGYPALEILLVDDGSTDGSLETAAELAAVHDGVRVVRHPDGGNHGPGPTRNLGIREATGDYVCFLDSDDLVLPHRFTTCVPLLDTDPTVDGVYEWSVTRREEGGRTDLRPLNNFSCSSPDQVLRTILTEGRLWDTNTIMVRRELLLRCGGFSEQLRLGQDLALWLKLACVAKLVGGAEEPVAVYRLHGGNNSAVRDPAVYFPVALHAYLDAVRWTHANGIRTENSRLLAEKTINKCFFACNGCRQHGRPDLARELLLRTAQTIPAILVHRKFWGNLVRSLKEQAFPAKV